MMKIINVTSDHNIGGAGRCILTFLEHYDREKYEVSVVLPKESALIPFVENTGTRYIEVEGLQDKSFSSKGVNEIIRVLRKEKPDVVHAHASFSARIAAKLCGIPVIYTRHSVFPNSKIISKGIGKLINGFVNNNTADKIIAVAGAAKDNLTDAGVSEKKIIVIKNGVKPLVKLNSEEVNSVKERFGIKNEFLFAMIARVEDIKGHIYFVEAAKKIIEDGYDAKFFVCGTGNYLETVKNKANELGVSDNFIFTGYIKDVSEIMNIIDVNVNASYGTEATSLSLLEGMSIGKPIIASNYGGNVELIEEGTNGVLFESKNSEQLYEKMKYLLEEKDVYRKLSEGAEKLYLEKYTADINADNIENIYEQVRKKK